MVSDYEDEGGTRLPRRERKNMVRQTRPDLSKRLPRHHTRLRQFMSFDGVALPRRW